MSKSVTDGRRESYWKPDEAPELQSGEVYRSRNSNTLTHYHTKKCVNLRQCANVIITTETSVEKQGLTVCSICTGQYDRGASTGPNAETKIRMVQMLDKMPIGSFSVSETAEIMQCSDNKARLALQYLADRGDIKRDYEHGKVMAWRFE